MGLGDTFQLLKDIKNGLEVNAAALALSGSRNAAGTRISRIDTPITAHTVGAYGKVILFDDFENTAPNWVGGGTSAHASNAAKFTTNGTNLFRGDGVMQVHTSATTPLDGQTASVNRHLSGRSAKKFSIELMANHSTGANLKYITYSVLVYDSALKHTAAIRYDMQADNWEYQSGAAAWTVVPAPVTTKITTNAKWHYIRFTFDIENSLWLEIQIDEAVADMRAVTLLSAADTTNGYMDMTITISNEGATENQIFIDDVLISDVTESV